jgi:anti-sigma B factor antagonist
MLSIELSAVEDDGLAVVVLWGELDVTDAARVASALAVMVADSPNIVVDLTCLEFIDCCGLRALAGAREQARRAGGDLLLTKPQQQVLRMLGLTGLAGVFSVQGGPERPEAAHARNRDRGGYRGPAGPGRR